MRLLLLIALLFVAQGCAHGKLANGSEVFFIGKGCAVADKTSLVVESDGISVNLGAILRSFGTIAGGILGGGAVQDPGDKLQSGEGCRGVLEHIYGDEDVETLAE